MEGFLVFDDEGIEGLTADRESYEEADYCHQQRIGADASLVFKVTRNRILVLVVCQREVA